jgi:hypothetical protein
MNLDYDAFPEPDHDVGKARHGTGGFSVLPLSVAALAFAVALMLAGCSKEKKDEAKTAPEEKKPEAPSHVEHGTNGETIIKLDAATQKTMGLELVTLEVAHLNPQLKGYGRVLDYSALAAAVADLTTAQAADTASQAEVKRLKTLAAQSNASDRALQAAEATAAHDQAQLTAARLKLTASWSSALADRQDLGELVQRLGSFNAALVELDVPGGEAVPAMPTGARLLSLADQTKPFDAQVLGPAPSVDPQMQGRGFLLLVEPNPNKLAPGAAVTGFLQLPGEPQTGVTVPRETLVRFNGAAWVYKQTGDETFERVEVPLEQPIEAGWFVTEGVKAGDKVVRVGAGQMLSEELKGLGGGEE